MNYFWVFNSMHYLEEKKPFVFNLGIHNIFSLQNILKLLYKIYPNISVSCHALLNLIPYTQAVAFNIFFHYIFTSKKKFLKIFRINYCKIFIASPRWNVTMSFKNKVKSYADFTQFYIYWMHSLSFSAWYNFVFR